MTTRIKLDPAAFGAGKLLFGVDPAKARVQLGRDDFESLNGVGLGIVYANEELNKTVSRASVTVTQNPIDVDDVQVDRWSQNVKLALADMVQKGVIIVERPVATPLTASAIRAL